MTDLVIDHSSTLADALAFLRQHPSLSGRMLVEAQAAVRLLIRETGQDAGQLPAAPKDLTPILETAFSARRRVSRKRWSNAVSVIRAMLRACGLHAPRPRDTQPSDPAWAALAEALPTAQERASDAWRRPLGFRSWRDDRPNSLRKSLRNTLNGVASTKSGAALNSSERTSEVSGITQSERDCQDFQSALCRFPSHRTWRLVP